MSLGFFANACRNWQIIKVCASIGQEVFCYLCRGGGNAEVQLGLYRIGGDWCCVEDSSAQCGERQLSQGETGEAVD